MIEFQKRHLKTSEKTAKKNSASASSFKPDNSDANSTPLGVSSANASSLDPPTGSSSGQPKLAPKKKVYTPFPPPQPLSKIDLQLASGEYFLKPRDKELAARRERLEKQHEKTEEKRATREEAFIAPPEKREETVKEKRKKRKAGE